MKVFRKIALALAALLAVVSVLLFTIDLGFLHGSIEQRVREFTGREFSVSPDLSISLGREIVILAQDVRLGNPAWAGPDPFVTATRVSAVVELFSLWRGPLVVRSLEVDELMVAMQQSEDGSKNWAFGQPSANDPAGPPALRIDSLVARDGGITIRSPRLDQPVTIRIDLAEQALADNGMVRGSMSGAVNGRPSRLDAALDSLHALLQGQAVTFQGEGQFGGVAVRADFELDNALAPLKAVGSLAITGPDFNELTGMLGIEGLAGGPLELGLTSKETAGGLSISAAGTLGELVFDADAELASLREPGGAVVHLAASGPNFGRVARLAGARGWPETPFDLVCSVRYPEPAVEIEQFELSLAQSRIELVGDIPHFPSSDGADVSLQIAGPSLAPFRDLLELGEVPDGAFSLSGSVRSGEDGLTRLDLTYELPAAAGTLGGELGGGADRVGTRLDLVARGEDAAQFGLLFNIPGLPGASWEASVGLAVTDPAFHDISGAVFTTDGLNLRLSGQVGAESPYKDTRLDFEVSGSRLADFQALAGEAAALPEQEFEVAGNVTSIPGAWRLANTTARVGTTRLELEGDLGRDGTLDGTDLSVAVSGTDLRRVFDLPGQARLPDGPFFGSARVALREGRLTLTDVHGEAGPFRMTANAEIPWPLDDSGGRFETQVSGVDITRVLPELAGLQLDAGPYEVNLDGRWQEGTVHVAAGKIRIGDSQLSAKGILDLPPGLAATDFSFEFSSPDLSRLGTVGGARWGTVPLDLSGSFSGTGYRISLDRFDARLGERKIEGRFDMDFEPEIPAFDLAFEADSVDFRPFQVEPPPDAAASSETKNTRLLPDLEFPMDQLDRANGRFRAHADRVLLKRMTLHNVQIDGELRDGRLEIGEISTDGYRGRLVSAIMLEPGPDGIPLLQVSADAQQLIINLSQQSEQDKEALPAFNIDIDLSGSGAGLREVAAALGGKIRINSPGGKVRNARSESASALFLAEVVSAISPGASRQEVITLSCVAAAIDVKNGFVLLDPGLALQSDKLNVFAGGKIDLNTEKIDINFRTQTRKAVDIAASELFSPYVKLSGTLVKPSVALDPKGTLLSGGAAYLSGGLSILAKKALGSLAGSKDPCAGMLEKAAGQ